jgi:ligand-binding sensor domain-containing protein/signal transduction histidine kinase
MKHIKKTIGSSFFFISLFFTSVTAQKNKLHFESITVEQGLSQSTVTCILQDSKGFLWLGTRDGLNQYNGYGFTIFNKKPADTSSLSSNIIYSLYEDRQKQIWIGTQEGLHRFNRNTQTFTVFKHSASQSPVKQENSLSHNTVKAILEDQRGNLWVGTASGLNQRKAGTQGFTTFWPQAGNKNSISHTNITCLLEDKRGFIWIGTAGGGLNCFDPETGIFQHYQKNDQPNSISSNYITSLTLDKEGEIWVGTDNGLNRLVPSTGHTKQLRREYILHYQHTPQDASSISHNAVTVIVQGASGLLWVGTDGGGLNRLDKHTGKFYTYQTESTDANSLLNNTILSICDDQAGTLWIGTQAGISKVDRQPERFTLFKKDDHTPNTLTNANIQNITEDIETHSLWIATYDGGLNRLNRQTGAYTSFTTKGIFERGMFQPERKNMVVATPKRKLLFFKKKKQLPVKPAPKVVHLSNDRVFTLFQDKSSILWIGTANGLNQLNTRTEKFTHHKAHPHPDSLGNNVIRALAKDLEGNIWVGTEGGLYRFNGRKFTRYRHDSANDQSISHDFVQALATDLAGNLWIGTYGGGLNKYNTQTGKLTRYFKKEGDPQSLSSNVVFSIRVAQNGTVWIGTSEGLNKFDPTTATFTTLSTEQGLANDFVYGILDDLEGNLWVSTNKGISKCTVKNGTFKNYTPQDGLQGEEFNPGACYRSKSGELFFGGIWGFNSFFPAQLKDNTFVPPIIITDFKIFNKKVPIGTEGSPLQKHISETDQLILSYEDAVFSFDFVALNFTGAKRNQYAYRMENFEDEWNYVQDRQFATYTNLAPGDYVFRVKGSNNDGVWNEAGTSIKITITPPFWRTWLFYFLCAIVLGGSVFLFIRIRLHRLEAAKKQLEITVQLRTRQFEQEKNRVEEANHEILKQKEEIEAQNDQLLESNQNLFKAKQQIDEVNKQLKEINANLEEKVLERTAALQQTNESLTVAVSELDLFIYRASHDLQGPIARLQGLTQVAKLEIKETVALHFIQLLERESAYMQTTLSKLLMINIVFANTCIYTSLSIHQVWDEVTALLADKTTQANASIELYTQTDIQFTTAVDLFRVILKNTLDNALDFRKPGAGPACLIRVWIEKSENALHITIEDNGIGIPEVHLSKIFNMFYRGSELSRGNGLGLYIVKKAVDKLGGEIQVISTEGKGTVLQMCIPEYISETVLVS